MSLVLAVGGSIFVLEQTGGDMKRTVIATLVLPCFLGAGLTYLIAARGGDAHATAKGSDQAALSELRAELQQVKRALSTRRTEQAVEMLKAAHQVEPDPLTDRAEGENGDIPDEPSRAQPATTTVSGRPFTEEEARARLESRFDGETTDTAWRSEATPILQRQFTKHATSGSRVTGIDCRQSLCRVETVHKDFETYRTYIHSTFASTTEWQGGAMMHVVGDPATSDLKAIAYMARPGENISLMMQEDP